MTESRPDLDELAAPILQHSVRASLDLVVGECSIRIESNSEELIEHLRDYFGHFVAEAERPDFVVTAIECDAPEFDFELLHWPRDPGKVGKKDAYADLRGGRAVRKVRTGMQYLFGGKMKLAFGPCLENDNQVINFVNAQYMSWLLDQDHALCHAAGVVADGRGLAIAGMSGGGKSTLALHLMSHGLAFTSNDRLLVQRTDTGARMAGLPKLPRINPGTALNNPNLKDVLPAERRRALIEMDSDELWDLEEKYDVDVERLFGVSRFEMNAPLDAFLVLNWARDAEQPARFAKVDLRERRDLLGAIMKAPGPFYQPMDDTPPPPPLQVDPEHYLHHLSQVEVFEASGRTDFGAGVDFALDLLARGQSAQ